jgi:hypothetical protein
LNEHGACISWFGDFMLRTLLFLLGIFSLSDAAQAQGWFGGAGPASFDAVYSSGGQTNWLLMLVAAIGAGLFVYVTAGTGSAAVGTLGTWIGSAAGLSGAAAKSYGLALLGGGALTAGGFGVKGGVALLTAALTFGQDAVVPYAFGVVRERFDRAAFEERVRSAPRFPLPRSDVGPQSYSDAVRLIARNYTPEASYADPRNNIMVGSLITSLRNTHAAERLDDAGNARVSLLLALLHFHQGEDQQAKARSALAIDYMLRSANRRPTAASPEFYKPETWIPAAKANAGYALASAIWAAASLSGEDANVNNSLSALDAAFGMEPKNGLAPLAAAIFMDRLIARQDIMTIAHLDTLRLSARTRLTDEKARSATLLVIMTRALVALKLEQSLVTATKDAPRGTTADGAAIKARADKSFAAYDAALKLLDDVTKDLLRDDAFSKDAANRAEVVKLIDLISDYKNDRLRLGGIIAALP